MSSPMSEPTKVDELQDPQDITLHGLEFRLTCSSCPEQYEVFREGKRVAYVRLRHGFLSVNAPDCVGKEILSHEFDGHLGWFDTASQRHGWLNRIARAILEGR